MTYHSIFGMTKEGCAFSIWRTHPSLLSWKIHIYRKILHSQLWLSIMGHLPKKMKDKMLYDFLTPYIENEKYIAFYTNIACISAQSQKMNILTYHEDFLIASISKTLGIDESGIRLPTIDDLPYIETTYTRPDTGSCSAAY